MVTRVLFFIVLLLLGARLQAADIAPVIRDRHIGARVRGLALPDSLRKDLRSGLTNRLLLRITLLEGAQTLANANVEIALKYDVWDERFRRQLTVNGTPLGAPELRTVEDAWKWLGDLSLMPLFDQPATTAAVTMRAEVLLNPIERERMDQIREWVKENSRYVPLGGAPSAALDSSNSIFNRIFERYATGPNTAAQWREEVKSALFDAGARER
jgi:transposase